jgi:transcriptional regulator with XRE-family HTH domain
MPCYTGIDSTPFSRMTTLHTVSLGEFIRTRRERLTPERVGLPPGSRRRAKGLRREELAGLCGISPTWLTWIEQGRTEGISASTVERIAGALLLSRAERRYLFELAGMQDPERSDLPCDPHLNEMLNKVVTKVQAPAYVLDYAWNTIAWNNQAAQLFTGWLGKSSGERNLLRYTFLNPDARTFISDWRSRAQRLVAEFRGDCRAAVDTPEIASQVEQLCRKSKEFDLFWSTQNVLEREGGERKFNHPKHGPILLQQLTLSLAASPGMKLVVLV